jgi:hypothetical protein
MDPDTVLGIGLLLATIALAWATFRLSGHTRRYVDLTRTSLQVVEAASAPRLTLSSGGYASYGDRWEGRLTVHNVGGGIAQSVEVVSNWGTAHADEAILVSGDQSPVRFAKTHSEMNTIRGTKDEQLIPERVRFVDVRGQHHEAEARPEGPSVWIAVPRSS